MGTSTSSHSEVVELMMSSSWARMVCVVSSVIRASSRPGQHDPIISIAAAGLGRRRKKRRRRRRRTRPALSLLEQAGFWHFSLRTACEIGLPSNWVPSPSKTSRSRTERGRENTPRPAGSYHKGMGCNVYKGEERLAGLSGGASRSGGRVERGGGGWSEGGWGVGGQLEGVVVLLSVCSCSGS